MNPYISKKYQLSVKIVDIFLYNKAMVEI